MAAGFFIRKIAQSKINQSICVVKNDLIKIVSAKRVLKHPHRKCVFSKNELEWINQTINEIISCLNVWRKFAVNIHEPFQSRAGNKDHCDDY